MPMHICTGTVAIVHKCTIMHKLMCVFFSSNCVKSITFFIMHNYGRADVIALIALCHAATHKTVDVWIGSRATCGDIVSCTSCTGDAEVLNVLLV